MINDTKNTADELLLHMSAMANASTGEFAGDFWVAPKALDRSVADDDCLIDCLGDISDQAFAAAFYTKASTLDQLFRSGFLEPCEGFSQHFRLSNLGEMKVRALEKR